MRCPQGTCSDVHIGSSNGKPRELQSEVPSVVKRNLIEIAEILLRAGARAFGKFTPRKSAEPIRASKTTRLVKDDPDLEPLQNLMQSFAEDKNWYSGGLEVLELLAKVKASSRSLRVKSFFRLAVRRHLTPPIIHEVDIDRLPLPYQDFSQEIRIRCHGYYVES